MGKNRAASPEFQTPKRPVICAKKRTIGTRNFVDHVAVELGNEEALFNTTAHRHCRLEEEAHEAAAKHGKKNLSGISSNTVDHVARINSYLSGGKLPAADQLSTSYNESAGRGYQFSPSYTNPAEGLFCSPQPLLSTQAPQPRPASFIPAATPFSYKSQTERAATPSQATQIAAEKEYFGDNGLSRKKAVPPPKESILHPATGQLLPSARAASTNGIFARSEGMNAARLSAIASGDFNVPLARQRSSIALNRIDANNAAATIDNRHAKRAAHPSESSHTKYLFGSAAEAERNNLPPGKAPHPLDATTFDKDPSIAELGKRRRQAYAIEMVLPRDVPTNVSSFAIKDDIPTHEQLLTELKAKVPTRRGNLAQQYNNTDGFFDPALPLPSRPSTPQRSQSPILHTALREEQRRASSVTSHNPNHMSVLERRSMQQHGGAVSIPYGGRRSQSPTVDTARVLCPDRMPDKEFRPLTAPFAGKDRCQAAAVMEEMQPSVRSRSIDTPRPTGLRSNFSAFVHPQMPLRACTPNATQISQLWGPTLGGNGFTASVAPASVTRWESPRGKRRVESPARSSSVSACFQ